MKNNAGINTSIDNRIDWEIVLDSMEEPIMILDLGSRIIKCNKALGALIGLPVENLLGRTCGAVIHDGGRSPSNCPVMKMVASRSRQSANQYIKDKWFNVVVDHLFLFCCTDLIISPGNFQFPLAQYQTDDFGGRLACFFFCPNHCLQHSGKFCFLFLLTRNTLLKCLHPYHPPLWARKILPALFCKL